MNNNHKADKEHWKQAKTKFRDNVARYILTYYNLYFEHPHTVTNTNKWPYEDIEITRENFPFDKFINELVKYSSWYDLKAWLDEYRGDQDIVIKSGNATFNLYDDPQVLARVYKNSNSNNTNH